MPKGSTGETHNFARKESRDDMDSMNHEGMGVHNKELQLHKKKSDLLAKSIEGLGINKRLPRIGEETVGDEGRGLGADHW